MFKILENFFKRPIQVVKTSAGNAICDAQYSYKYCSDIISQVSYEVEDYELQYESKQQHDVRSKMA